MFKTFISKKEYIIVSLMIIFLLISNIFFIYKYYKEKDNEVVRETLIFNNDKEYDEDKIYYTEINYKTFNTLIKKDKVITIAVIDNSSKTYKRFLDMVNQIAYYKKTNIYLFEVSKLSKKNEISFYEIDDRLKSLESDYLITICNNKIISITTFDTEKLTNIIESLK